MRVGGRRSCELGISDVFEEEKAEQLEEKGPRGAAGAATGNGRGSVGEERLSCSQEMDGGEEVVYVN